MSNPLDEPCEEWRPVVGWEGAYEVSSLGKVWSIRSGRLLKPWVNKSGYLVVTASLKGVRKHLLVHREVLKSFEGVSDLHGLHWDGDKANNKLDNLRWGTASENMYDAVRQGAHPRAKKTHCINGHEYTLENTTQRLDRPKARECRTCRSEHAANRREKRAKVEPPKHGTVNGYISHKCRCIECKESWSEYQKERRSNVKS